MPKKEAKRRKLNKKSTSKASPSAIEVEKAYHLQKLRVEMGWTWFELSYMLGKDNGSYVRDVENPLHTLKYDPADVNYIGLMVIRKLICLFSGGPYEPSPRSRWILRLPRQPAH